VVAGELLADRSEQVKRAARTAGACFIAALACCAVAPSQSSEPESKPARALSADTISLSDLYDKASGIYFQPSTMNPPKLPAIDCSDLSQQFPTVAILDSGIMHSHPLLKDVTIVDQDFTGEGPEDRNGHGTFVTLTYLAGVSIACGDTQRLPKPRILNIKVLRKDGRGDRNDVKNGMQWAVDHGAKILNMSLGLPQSHYPDVCALATKLIKEHSIAIIAAAGNDPGIPMCPAMAEGVISAGATEVQSPMQPTSTGSSRFTWLPVTAPSAAGQENACDAGTWRASYLAAAGKGSAQDTAALVKQCPSTAKAVAQLLFFDSRSAYEKRDCNTALGLAEASYQIDVDLQDIRDQGFALNEVGVMFTCRSTAAKAAGDLNTATGEMAKASTAFKGAAALFTTAEVPESEGGAVGNEESALKHLGQLEQHNGDFAGSVDTLNNALVLARAPEVHDRKGEAEILGTLCSSYLLLGNLAAAAGSCNDSLGLARDQNNNALVGEDLLNLGMTEVRERAYGSARQHLQEASTVCGGSGDSSCVKIANGTLQLLNKLPAGH
jgi:tetratricopeptide (TPR) repeat protein